MPTIRVCATAEELAWQAAERFVEYAEEAVVSTGRFAVALPGGSTPRAFFRLLAGDFSTKIPWDKTHVLFADERCVPPSHADSNFAMACRELLDHVPIDYGRVHRMAGELEAKAAADQYQQLLESQFPKGLDLVLLSVGEDGHTASLFPRTAALQEMERYCVANYVPEKDAWRLTLTAGYINRAFDVMVLAAGAEKARAVAHALEGTASATECPIRLISPSTGRLVWMLDAPAAGMDFAEDADADMGNGAEPADED